jgi:hypothetical protein
MSEVRSTVSNLDVVRQQEPEVIQDDWYIVSQLQLLKQFEEKEQKKERLEQSKLKFREELAR